jgi:hypothetical protein
VRGVVPATRAKFRIPQDTFGKAITSRALYQHCLKQTFAVIAAAGGNKYDSTFSGKLVASLLP